jgi:formylglycine-generating enzyme required for sulfatase activity
MPMQLLAQDSFWDNADMVFKFGINSFHGDFDTNVNGDGADIMGLPSPIDGFHLGFGISKPLASLKSTEYKIRLHFGLDYVQHQSPTLTQIGVINTNNIQGVIPINIKNIGIGPYGGLGFEYLVSQSSSIEPYIMLTAYYNDPRTDGFVNGSMQVLTPSETGLNRPYRLVDLPQTRNQDEATAVSSFILGAKAGVRFNKVVSGTARFFVDYNFLYFLNDYFDNTSGALQSGTGASQNDAMTMLTMGFQLPMNGDIVSSMEAERQIVKVDRKKVAKIERIQNIANLVTNDEDLRELQRIMSDKILLYDTPGVRFNELASKTIQRRVRLSDTDIESEMIELPGGSYIIGLTSVDELNIQVQGRKRITINPFMVDKYEVTNEQYRAFLISMGALQPPPQTNPAIPVTNYGTRLSIQELLSKAGLDNIADYRNSPRILSIDDLLPDSTSWSKMGLDEVIPWGIYFYDPFYSDRPIVCVSWFQSKLYAAWAGKRLMTESEWEFAARSGVSGRVFPWDGLDVQTKTGKYRANFKQDRGVYDADGYPIMAPVDSYQPNDFGLHNMSGNVSEWVIDSWNPSYVVLQNVGTANFVSPSYNNIKEPRRIHRGGSWQSTSFYIGVGVRNFQEASAGTPFIGFRCAKSVVKRFR